MAKSTRGGKYGVGKGDFSANSSAELSEERMVAEMNAEFEKINEAIDTFMNQKGTITKFGDLEFKSLNNDNFHNIDLGYTNIEKYPVKRLVKDYIDEFNKDLKEYGDGFAYWDEDTSMSILYKDGHTETISPQWWDGTKRIPKTGVDSIIVESSWGTAIAGKNVEVVNYRQAVGYGRYGYRDIRHRYNDWNDIRVDFK